MAERRASSALWVPLTAGLVGAGLALLFAPRSGRETREKLRGNFEGLKDRADSKLAAAREKVDDSLEEAKALKSRLTDAIKKEPVKKSGREKALDSGVQEDEPLMSNWEGEV